ncbi:hypothetical protein, partial [Alicyclobacillus contaminans]|uniref:hypothetical protein n=1 Tax=Alicyclobacillus contaminans TaxID=392016 RepID=UPI00047CD78C
MAEALKKGRGPCCAATQQEPDVNTNFVSHEYTGTVQTVQPCPCCGEPDHPDAMFEALFEGEVQKLCQRCVDWECHTCIRCGRTVHKDDAEAVDWDRYRCQPCHERVMAAAYARAYVEESRDDMR